jgi:hypothetical protein
MVVQIEMLVGDRGRVVNVTQEKADAFIGAGFARIVPPSDPISDWRLDIPTPGKPRLGRPTVPRVAEPIPGTITQPMQIPAPIRPAAPIDRVDAVTGFDVDVEKHELPGPAAGSVLYAKPNPVAPPAGVPVKTEPLSKIGETVSTGRPATVMGGVMPKLINTRWTGRLPGGGTVSAPRSGPDDPSTMPQAFPVEILKSGLNLSPRTTRIIKNAVPVAAHVACRILSKGRISGSASKALCGLLSAGLKRAIR